VREKKIGSSYFIQPLQILHTCNRLFNDPYARFFSGNGQELLEKFIPEKGRGEIFSFIILYLFFFTATAQASLILRVALVDKIMEKCLQEDFEQVKTTHIFFFLMLKYPRL